MVDCGKRRRGAAFLERGLTLGGDMQTLYGRVAFVVAASGRVGAAIARCFGELGASVVLSPHLSVELLPGVPSARLQSYTAACISTISELAISPVANRFREAHLSLLIGSRQVTRRFVVK